jgi:hypothetical protein
MVASGDDPSARSPSLRRATKCVSLIVSLGTTRLRMKLCPHCGGENPDDSAGCLECGNEAFATGSSPKGPQVHRRKRGSLRRRAKDLRWRVDRSYRIGSIAMLPAGLILLGSAAVELASGNYRVGLNRFGDPVGPLLRAVFGLAFSCAGAVALGYYLRRRKRSGPRTEKPAEKRE